MGGGVKVVRFRADARVIWAVRQGKTAWVADCDALGLTAQGTTWQELTEMIADIMADRLRDLLTEGRLEQVLRQHGWQPIVAVPRNVSPEDLYFDLPFHMESAAAHHAVA